VTKEDLSIKESGRATFRKKSGQTDQEFSGLVPGEDRVENPVDDEGEMV
jgi:hypothetical protein